MKAIKPPKQPNPNGRPLPSQHARVFYCPFWFKEVDGQIQRIRFHRTGEKLVDFYEKIYEVQPDASIRAIVA